MNLLSKSVMAAASMVALTATTVSAEIVCNDEGDCCTCEKGMPIVRSSA